MAKKIENAHPTWPPTGSHPRIPISPCDWGFIPSCWETDPSKRPTIVDLAELCQIQFHQSLLTPQKTEKKIAPRDPFSPLSLQYSSFQNSPVSSIGGPPVTRKGTLAGVSPPMFGSGNSSPFSLVSGSVTSGIISGPSTYSSSKEGYSFV